MRWCKASVIWHTVCLFQNLECGASQSARLHARVFLLVKESQIYVLGGSKFCWYRSDLLALTLYNVAGHVNLNLKSVRRAWHNFLRFSTRTSLQRWTTSLRNAHTHTSTRTWVFRKQQVWATWKLQANKHSWKLASCAQCCQKTRSRVRAWVPPQRVCACEKPLAA